MLIDGKATCGPVGLVAVVDQYEKSVVGSVQSVVVQLADLFRHHPVSMASPMAVRISGKVS